MSSYFDDFDRDVSEMSDANDEDENFIEKLGAMEERMFWEITSIIGDREFPDEYRQLILNTFAQESVRPMPPLTPPAHAAELCCMMRHSLVNQTLHSIYHEVASRRIETRFGRWSDSPTNDKVLRNDFDAG